MGKAIKSWADWRIKKSQEELTFYRRKYRNLVKNMFVWKNLPCGIPARYIEEQLYYEGFCIFFQLPNGAFAVSNATCVGLNMYNEPTGFHVTNKDINLHLKSSDCVVIYNDINRENSAYQVNFYANKINDIERTLDCNLQQLKNPTFFIVPENQKESFKKMIKLKEEGVNIIPVSEDFNKLIDVKNFNLNPQNYTKELIEIRQTRENEFLTTLGIDNCNILKRERLTSGEVEQNNEQINLIKLGKLDERKKACEKINKFLIEKGFDHLAIVDVEINENIMEEVENV